MRSVAAYLASLTPCTVCSQCQPHPARAHSDLGVALLMLDLELRKDRLPRARAWANSIAPAPRDIESLPQCTCSESIETHPADTHDNLTVALHIIKREIAADRVQSARMWIANSKRLVELNPPPLTVRIVQTPERTLRLYQGGR